MKQGVLPFKYEVDDAKADMTALGGLPTYLDLARVLGLAESADKYLGARNESQGWTDGQIVTALVLLNLAGGDNVDDLKILEADEGLCKILRRVQAHGLARKERRALEGRWRKEKKRAVPSASAVFRYLAKFHDSTQEQLRQEGKAFIPAPNEHLQGFAKMNAHSLAVIQKNSPQETATLDMDATLVETSKADALFCYKGYKAYQPFNTWWYEQGVIAHTEFRDGNVPAGFEQLRVLKEALECLPEGVRNVRLRSDTAGYQHDLLRYCEMGDNKRFGRIEFAIGSDVTAEFKKAVAEVEESKWQPFKKLINGCLMETGKQWAEVCFVPNAIGRCKTGLEYRYLAIRESLEQSTLPGVELEKEYPFPTMAMKKGSYKIFGIVTNMDWDGEELIRWLHKRCGKSEEAHSVMKQDLAGGCLPSNKFGQNAAWWWIMILALNLNEAMKRLALDKSWVSRRMKAMRFGLINVPARVMERSRSLLVHVSQRHPALVWLLMIRERILNLQPQALC